MKRITLFCFGIYILLSCSKPELSADFHMPAEWEPHDAIWLGWEDESVSYHAAVIEVIKSLTPHVSVKIASSSDSLAQVARKILFEQGVDSTRVSFFTMPGDRYWIRDHGAAFLVNDKGELGVADFGWNRYGYPGFIELKYGNHPDTISKYMSRTNPLTGSVDSMMAVNEGATILKTRVKHEGGAIEVNGKGTLILCEATVFQRNPDMTREELEVEFKRVLGVSKIIWMKKGLADDPHYFMRRIVDNYVGGGTGGHTDEFVRFANPNTILLAWVDETEKDLNSINKMNYERMNENLKILEQATDQDGKPFTIVKVPLPDLITRKVNVTAKSDWLDPNNLSADDFITSEAPKVGDTVLRVPASSYLNYLVSNGVVILPTYTEAGSSKEKEEAVRKIFETQFPGRELKFVEAMPQNFDGGGIHCSTQQQPAKRK